MFRDIRKGINNLWKWRKVIWKDRDNDFYPLLEILYFKLLNMEEYADFESDSMSSDDVARQIRKTRVILQKLKDDVYENKAFCKHEKKWGKNRFYVDDKTNKLEIEKEKLLSEEDKRQEKEEFRKMINKTGEHCHKMLNKALDNMKENLYNWYC